MSTGPGLFGFSVLVNEIRTNSECTEPSPSSRNWGLSDTTVSLPVRNASMDSEACACSDPIASSVTPSIENVNRSGSLALEHERDATHGFDELGGVHDRVVVDGVREEPPTGREVALDEQGCHGLVLSAENAMSSRSSVLVMATEIVPRVPERLADLMRVRAGTSAVAAVDTGGSGIPVDLADGDPVAVGGDEREAVLGDLQLNAGDDRGHVVAGRGDRDLRDRGGELLRRQQTGIGATRPAGSGIPQPACSEA